MAIEIQIERLRVAEVINARDVLVYKLSDAYTSIREKTELIERLQKALKLLMNKTNSDSSEDILLPGAQQTEEAMVSQLQLTDLDALIQGLQIHSKDAACPPPEYEEEEIKVCSPCTSYICTFSCLVHGIRPTLSLLPPTERWYQRLLPPS